MLKIIGTFLLIGLMNTSAVASDIKLPQPDKSNKTTLIQALEKRQSSREFSDEVIDNETLSTILWAAYGVNRPDGKRTIPTAKGEKDLYVYVFNQSGVFLYDADLNALKMISQENHLDLFNKQDYMDSVSTVLVYTGGDNDYSALHAGSAYQSVELYASANDMACIVRGFFDYEKVSEVLDLPKEQRVIVSQAIGWKK